MHTVFDAARGQKHFLKPAKKVIDSHVRFGIIPRLVVRVYLTPLATFSRSENEGASGNIEMERI
jgi:hypothetical protein